MSSIALNIYADDYLEINGTVEKPQDGKAIIRVATVKESDASIFDKALKTITVNKTIEHQGLKINLQKVELAKRSTKVFLNVVDKSTDTGSVYISELFFT